MSEWQTNIAQICVNIAFGKGVSLYHKSISSIQKNKDIGTGKLLQIPQTWLSHQITAVQEVLCKETGKI